MKPYLKRAWAEISLEKLRKNTEVIRSLNSGKTDIMAVVKADAYGHGDAHIVHCLVSDCNIRYFAVSNLDEAISVRDFAPNAEILILGYTPPECADLLASHHISQCVYSRTYGEALSQAAMSAGVRVHIHIKIDTGMGRIGFQHHGECDELADALAVCKLPCLLPEGIFTHFASADEGEAGEAYTQMQFQAFIPR